MLAYNISAVIGYFENVTLDVIVKQSMLLCDLRFRTSAFQYIQENAATIAGQIKTLSENNLDILAVQIAEWCMKVPSLQMDVNVVSNLLSILNKLGRSEDFHRQVCRYFLVSLICWTCRR